MKKVLATRLPAVILLAASLLFMPACDSGVPARHPYGVYSPGSLQEGPPDAGQETIRALGLDDAAAYADYNLDLMSELGISWVRLDFIYDAGRFQDPEYIDRVRERGLEVVGNARPVATAPGDIEAFAGELARLVHRYPWIKTWQIGNEPNLGWKPGDYAALFAAGQRVVRAECPDCRVALGGVASLYGGRAAALGYYRRLFDALDGERFTGAPFDVFDLHYYGAAGAAADMVAALADYQQLLAARGYADAVAYWVTETSTTTGSPQPPPVVPTQSEEQQAAELVSRFVAMLGAGVERIAWARPYENYRYNGTDDGYYDHNALVYNGLGSEAARGIPAGTRKLAFHAYRLLVEKTDGFEAVERLGPGRYRFRFGDDRPPVYVLWGEGAADIEPGSTLLITSLDGSTQTLPANELILGQEPVFAERTADEGDR